MMMTMMMIMMIMIVLYDADYDDYRYHDCTYTDMSEGKYEREDDDFDYTKNIKNWLLSSHRKANGIG